MEYNNNNTKSKIINLQLYAHFRSVKVLFTNIKVCFMLIPYLVCFMLIPYLVCFMLIPYLVCFMLTLLSDPVQLLYEYDAT